MNMSHTECIATGEPVFAGHFPLRPILPGVLLLAIARRAASRAVGRPLALKRIVRQRFVRPVLPDSELTLEMSVSDAGEGADGHRVHCSWLQADGAPVARAELVLG